MSFIAIVTMLLTASFALAQLGTSVIVIPCNNNGVCESFESQNECSNDCGVSSSPSNVGVSLAPIESAPNHGSDIRYDPTPVAVPDVAVKSNFVSTPQLSSGAVSKNTIKNAELNTGSARYQLPTSNTYRFTTIVMSSTPTVSSSRQNNFLVSSTLSKSADYQSRTQKKIISGSSLFQRLKIVVDAFNGSLVKVEIKVRTLFQTAIKFINSSFAWSINFLKKRFFK